MLVIGGMFVALFFLIVLSLGIGRYPIPLHDIARILLTTTPLDAAQNSSDTPWIVVELVRLPRVLLVCLCGMALALAGAAMQGVFRNPLVEPGIAGVTPGASVGGILAIMLSFSFWGVVLMAFAGGLLALTLTLVLARITGRSSILSLILAGVITGSFFGATVGMLEVLADPVTRLPAIIVWMWGSFANASYPRLAVVSITMLISGIPLLFLRWKINLLSLDEADARALGFPVVVFRWIVMVLVALLVAAQVAVSGGLYWVGLIVPHMARMLVGADHRRLLPASALLGSIYLLAMDDVARTIGTQEIPLGMLTTTLGAPLFAYLFWKTRGRGWRNE
jgi:iron complex transport system permease protein